VRAAADRCGGRRCEAFNPDRLWYNLPKDGGRRRADADRGYQMSTDRLFVQHATGDSSFVTRRIGGETIVVPVSSRVGDLDAIYTFNEVGSRIWSLLETPTALDTLVAVLSEEYDAPAEQLASDVRELLTTLQDKALIHTVDRPAAP
jgi:hypothetical protein